MRLFYKNTQIPPENPMRRAMSARAAAREAERFSRGLSQGLTKTLPVGLARKKGSVTTQKLRPTKKHLWQKRLRLRFLTYFYKMRGKNPVTHAFSWRDTCWSFGGAFLGMLVLALVNIQGWGRHEQGLLLGSFGASAMLVFGAPHAPFAQPRNVIGGHVVSALAGVFAQGLIGEQPWLAAALAVALSVSLMHITATLHPPGGATALLAVVGSPEIHELGYLFALYPVGLSVAVLVGTGVAYNNLSRQRRYPLYWW